MTLALPLVSSPPHRGRSSGRRGRIARRRSREGELARGRPDTRLEPADASRPLVHASITLPADEFRSLQSLAQRRNTSASQVVRQALATESCLQRVTDRGGLILASFGRRAHELVFSQL